jgi:serine/threonine protein kinase
MHEIRAQAQFDHESLVRAFDAGHDGNVYFLVTEYVPGTDLRKLVRMRGKLSMRDAATIISQVARGLAHAHARGLVHRDIKPGNVLVTPDGKAKLSDLGLASFLGNEDVDDPRYGRTVGTADYLSPEHISSPRELSPQSDIYSLGCTLYYAVTGKVPFPGGTTRDKARRHCDQTPMNPRRFNLDLTDDFIDVIATMMEKDPKKRIPSAAAVVDRLAPWAGDAVTSAASEGRQSGATSPTMLRPIPASQSDTQPGWFDDLMDGSDDSPSQVTQRTDPVASAEHETLPDDVVAPATAHAEAEFPLTMALVVLVPLLVAAGVLLASVAIKAFF